MYSKTSPKDQPIEKISCLNGGNALTVFKGLHCCRENYSICDMHIGKYFLDFHYLQAGDDYFFQNR